MQHSRPNKPGGPEKGPRKYYSAKKKFCHFCKDRIPLIDFKNYKVLENFVYETGKILPARMTGTCAYHQKQLSKAIKRARQMAMLRFVEER